MKMILNLFILFVFNAVFRWVFRPAESFTVNGVPVRIWTGKYAKWRMKMMGGHRYMAFVRTLTKWVSVNAPDGRVNMAIVLHEVAHITYPPAGGDVHGAIAHKGKGHRSEHQADRYAVDICLKKLPRDKAMKEIRDMCFGTIVWSSDGQYRINLIRRYLRRYYSIEL